MKKIFFILIAVFIASSGFSQHTNTSGLTVNPHFQYNQADTSRTFIITYNDYEQFRKKLMLAWGRPDVMTAGNLEWNHLNIQEIGQNLKVIVSDGISTAQDGTTYYKVFPDDNAKNDALKSMHNDQSRYLEIKFENQSGTNFITTSAMENSVYSVLDYITNSVW